MRLPDALAKPATTMFLLAMMSTLVANAAASDRGPRFVLRLRGGPSWEQSGNKPPAWFAGTSAGMLIAGRMTIMAAVDRISLDADRAATPVSLQVDYWEPYRAWVTPRIQAGLGIYLLQTA